jgi:chromosome partitioning protein
VAAVKGWSRRVSLVFHTVIKRTPWSADATVAGEPITQVLNSGSMGASSYRELAKEVLERWRQPGVGRGE